MNPADRIAAGLALPLWSVFPFVGFLLAMALLPLVASRLWARHFGKVSAVFGVPVAAWFLFLAPGELLHTTLEYLSFLVLLGSLFTISGGILLRGTIRGTPAVNCAFLAAGAALSNVLGTTGASMLLIRPLLRANSDRKRSTRVYVFFIFVVANIGGALTPVGDPPLFLGYLKGVPFLWTIRNLWNCWLAAAGMVIGIYYVLDRMAARSEGEAGSAETGSSTGRVPLTVAGKWNLLLLGTVIAAVFLPTPLRETAMLTATALSVWKTPGWIRRENGFTFHPIKEVAILFAGIFATMIPALLILQARGGELGITEPWHFFWGAGTLSSFLDNAPTYLTFLSLAQGLGGTADIVGVSAPILRAISAGAVFMGAITYIGNAPNFMVKAIVESSGVRMPSFFSYMAYSAVVLLPVFAIITWLFM
jgi:Na+/H+ antiporter NhaD/arsenite permease-like protein